MNRFTYERWIDLFQKDLTYTVGVANTSLDDESLKCILFYCNSTKSLVLVDLHSVNFRLCAVFEKYSWQNLDKKSVIKIVGKNMALGNKSMNIYLRFLSDNSYSKWADLFRQNLGINRTIIASQSSDMNLLNSRESSKTIKT
jgi:hypothetical protein